jgi:hypothetical protein
MSESLFKLDQRFLELAEKIEQNEGELTLELEKEFDDVCLLLFQKEHNYLVVENHLDGEITKCDKFLALVSQRKRSLQSQHKRLKQRLIDHMRFHNKMVIETDIGNIRLCSRKKVCDYPDVEALPPEYVKIEVIKKPDKKKLLKDLAEKDVDGAFLEESFYLRVF